MNPLVRGLTWPIVSLLLIGGTHFVAEALRPELATVIVPTAVMPIYLAVGAWAGYRTIGAGGTYVHGVVAGLILGLLPVVLQFVGFGMILGRESAIVTNAAIFGFLGITWGGLLGSGFAVSRPSS